MIAIERNKFGDDAGLVGAAIGFGLRRTESGAPEKPVYGM